MFATVDNNRSVCEKVLIGNPPRTNDYCDYARQPGDLRVLRGVVRGFSEEAKTRGFPYPSSGGFGFVAVIRNLSITLGV